MNAKIKLVNINIEGDKHLDKIISFLKKEDADIACIQEAIKDNIETLKGNIYRHYSYAPMLTMNRPPGMPSKGLLILIKDKPMKTEATYYVGSANALPIFDDDPTLENRALVTTCVQKDNSFFNVSTTHFTWSLDGETTKKQMQHFALLKNLLNNKNDLILCGDFNAPRGKEIFTQLSSMYKDNIPSHITSTIDPALHHVKNIEFVVDGLFTSPHYEVENIRVVEGISDHKGIVAIIKNLF